MTPFEIGDIVLYNYHDLLIFVGRITLVTDHMVSIETILMIKGVYIPYLYESNMSYISKITDEQKAELL